MYFCIYSFIESLKRHRNIHLKSRPSAPQEFGAVLKISNTNSTSELIWEQQNRASWKEGMATKGVALQNYNNELIHRMHFYSPIS